MPRARTQLGSASCADIVSVLAVAIQAMPASAMPSAASHSQGASATTSVITATISEPMPTMRSRLWRSRRRGSASTAVIAPLPMQAISSVKPPAPPPSRRATSGSIAVSAVLRKKNTNTRSSTARMRGFCATCCTPTRIAPTKRSPGSALMRGLLFQRRICTKASSDSTALSTNTAALPEAASTAPATIGPRMRDRFIAIACSASAPDSEAAGTISGTIAANTGQRAASPMPLAKVSSSSRCGVMPSASASSASSSATSATHSWVEANQRRRSTMSASAPLGRPSRKTGSVDAAETRATITALSVSCVISQAAATTFIHIVRLAASQASQSIRNTGRRSGCSACGRRSGSSIVFKVTGIVRPSDPSSWK